jgi:hypothetical protein
MSSKGEMSSGLTTGILQGFKTGFGFSKMESGFKKGLLNGIRSHDKVQDPTVGLIGSKRPQIVWFADYTDASPTGNTLTTVYNLMNTSQNLVEGSSVTYRRNGVFNNKDYLGFDSTADRISTLTTYTGTKELTLMMVVRLSSTSAGRVLFYRVSTTFADTTGDIVVTAEGGTKIRVDFIGNPINTSSIYETYDATLAGRWVILTVKVRTYQPTGSGSEMEIYLNGTLNMTPVTTTFGESTSNMSNTGMSFGNNSSATSAGSEIASAMVFNYWLNSSEQIRLENFYRYYYGYRF